MIRQMMLRYVLPTVLLSLCTFLPTARAQFIGGQQSVPTFLPQVIPGQSTQLTQQQLQAMMMMRMLQGGGMGRGVQTGYPQMVPNYGGFGQAPVGFAYDEEDTSSSRRSSSQKRADARKEREDQKRAAKDEAKNKKSKTTKKAKPKKDDGNS